jgi:hypothetical protein
MDVVDVVDVIISVILQSPKPKLNLRACFSSNSSNQPTQPNSPGKVRIDVFAKP